MIDLSLNRASSRISNVRRMNPVFPRLGSEFSGGALGALGEALELEAYNTHGYGLGEVYVDGLGWTPRTFDLSGGYNPPERIGLGGYGLGRIGTLVNTGDGTLIEMTPDAAAAYWAASALPSTPKNSQAPTPDNMGAGYDSFTLPAGYVAPAPYTPFNPAPWPPTDPREVHQLGFDCVPQDWNETVPGISTCGSGQSPIAGYDAFRLIGPGTGASPSDLQPGVIVPGINAPATNIPNQVIAANSVGAGKENGKPMQVLSDNPFSLLTTSPNPNGGSGSVLSDTPAAANQNTSSTGSDGSATGGNGIDKASLALALAQAAFARGGANTSSGGGNPVATNQNTSTVPAGSVGVMDEITTFIANNPLLIAAGVGLIGLSIMYSRRGR